MIPQQTHYCETCNTSIAFDRTRDFILKDETFAIRGESILIQDAKIPVCPHCGHEVSDEVLDNVLLGQTIAGWEEKTGKDFLSSIKEYKDKLGDRGPGHGGATGM